MLLKNKLYFNVKADPNYSELLQNSYNYIKVKRYQKKYRKKYLFIAIIK